MKHLAILIFIIFSSCVQKNSHTNNQKEHYHTQKLARTLGVHFVEQNSVTITLGEVDLSDLQIKIFYQTDGVKTLVYESLLDEKDTKITYTLEDSLIQKGGVLAAVLTAKDRHKKEVSSVDTFVINEQEEINSVKKNMLKN